jgi:thioredoxin 2
MPIVRSCTQCNQKNRITGKHLASTGRCGACKATLAPIAEPLAARTAQDMAGKAIVLKVDTEAHPELAARFDVRGIPNFVVLSGGRTVFQQAGLVGHQQMEQWLRNAEA